MSLLPSARPPTKLPRMPHASKLIEQIVKAGVTTTLKPLGFRKSGRTFRRIVESAVQVINVQSCKWNTADEASFRVNLGVFFPEIYSALYEEEGGRVSAAGPHEPDCTIRTTLGDLLPRPKDFWWKLHPHSAVDQVSANVASQLRELALPWLEAHTPLHAAVQVATGPYPIAIHLALGDRASALALAQRSLEETPQALAFHAWLRKQGLLPPF